MICRPAPLSGPWDLRRRPWDLGELLHSDCCDPSVRNGEKNVVITIGWIEAPDAQHISHRHDNRNTVARRRPVRNSNVNRPRPWIGWIQAGKENILRRDFFSIYE